MFQIFRGDGPELPPLCASGIERTDCRQGGLQAEVGPQLILPQPVASVLSTPPAKGTFEEGITGGKQSLFCSKSCQRRLDTSLMFSLQSTALLCSPHLWLCCSSFNGLPLSNINKHFILEIIPFPTALPSLTPRVTALGPSIPAGDPLPDRGPQLTSTFPAQSGYLGSLGTSH